MTDPDLEALIDRAGRDDVFALIQANGWSGTPPKHIWYLACDEVMRRRKENERG